MSSANRRRNPRIKAKSLAAHLDSANARGQCVVDNISVGGVFLRTAFPLPAGTELKLELLRPGARKVLSATGRVVNVLSPAAAQTAGVQPGMGVAFTDLGATELSTLSRLVVEVRSAAAPVAQPLTDVLNAAIEEELARPSPPPPVAPRSTPSKGLPLAPTRPTPSQAPPPLSAAIEDESTLLRLRTQLQGVFQQLGHLQEELVARDRELERLRLENSSLRDRLSAYEP